MKYRVTAKEWKGTYVLREKGWYKEYQRITLSIHDDFDSAKKAMLEAAMKNASNHADRMFGFEVRRMDYGAVS